MEFSSNKRQKNCEKHNIVSKVMLLALTLLTPTALALRLSALPTIFLSLICPCRAPSNLLLKHIDLCAAYGSKTFLEG